MLGKNKKPADQILIERQKKLERWIIKNAKLQQLTNTEGTGWVEYCDMIQSRIDQCKKRKAITNLAIADPQTLEQLKLNDHEIYVLTHLMKVPHIFNKNLEEELKKFKEQEELAKAEVKTA